MPPRVVRIKPPLMPNAVRDNAERHRFELDAGASYYIVEKPFLRLKRFAMPGNRKTV